MKGIKKNDPTMRYGKNTKPKPEQKVDLSLSKIIVLNVIHFFSKRPVDREALMMVMTLCLMGYGVSQHTLREASAKAGATIPDQTRKPTNKPRLKWVYFLFWGVHELRIEKETETRELVINVNALLKEIIGYFGERARRIY
jgi:transposase